MLVVKHFDGSKGRGLVTTKNVQKDQVLFTEAPLVQIQFSWNKKYGYVACEYCLKPLEDVEDNLRRLTGSKTLVVPSKEFCPILHSKPSFTSCLMGCGENYCSSTCRDSAYNTYHQIMCPANKTISKDFFDSFETIWNTMHYPPETSNIAIIIKIIAMIIQSSNKPDIINKFTQFCQSTSNESNHLALKLTDPKYQNKLTQLHELFKNNLNKFNLSDDFFTFGGFMSLIGLVCRNSQGIATSTFSLWQEKIAEQFGEGEQFTKFVEEMYDKIEENVGEFIDNEGIGLYEKQSLLNHSCDPNCQVKLNGGSHEISIVALREIVCGEEVTISYLNEHERECSRHSRQKQLREFYLFHCDCCKCQAQINDPDVTSDEEECDSHDEDMK